MNLTDFLKSGESPGTLGSAKRLLASARDRILSMGGRSAPATPAAYPNLPVLAFIHSRQWAITGEGLRSLASYAVSPDALSEGMRDWFEVRPEPSLAADGTGTVHVLGALTDGGPAILEKLSLVTRYETITSEMAGLVAKGAKSLRLVIDSPGGTVSGLREAAEAVASSKVPVHVFCKGMACSAAYHIAAGSKSITASPSATVGNIGTIISWADDSQFWQSLGIEFKALVNEGADLKSTFHTAPDKAQLAFLQERINEAGAQFKDHVQKHRKGIDSEVFRAGWYSGEKAVSLGLVDALGTSPKAAVSTSAKAPSTAVAAAPAAPNPITTPSKPSSSMTTPAAPVIRPTKYASFPDNAVIAVLKDYMPNREADKAAAAAEMTQRGYLVEGNRVCITRDAFEKMDHPERAEVFRAGFSITGSKSTPTPTEISAGAELTFPVGSKKTPRTAEQFLALTAAQTDEVIKLALAGSIGAEVRQELFDAYASYSPKSWRNDGKRNNNTREPFRQKFKPVMASIVFLKETPNDPPPPVSPNAMTAADFISLPAAAMEKLSLNMHRQQQQYRNQRAELKRAYVKATSAQKTALHALYDGALKAFPEELI